MAGEWTDWSDGNDQAGVLAGLSRSGDVLGKMGIDADEARANPAMQSQIREKLGNPYALMAQNTTPSNPAQPPQQPTVTAAAAPDPRMAVPAGEPPNPVLHTRNEAQVPPATLAQPTTSAAVSPSGTSSPAGKPNWQGAAAQAVDSTLQTADQAKGLFNSEPAAPDTTALDTKIQTDSIPTPLQNSEGKMLKEWRPGFWGEVTRGLRDAQLGAGGHPELETVYGAPNKAYGAAEAGRNEQLQQDQMQRTDILNRFKATTDALRNKGKDIDSVEPGYKDAGTMSVDAQKAQTEQVKESPEGKAAVAAAEFGEKKDQADQIFGAGKGGTMRTFYMAGWRPPDPKQPTAEDIRHADAVRAFHAQYGRGPVTLDEVNSLESAAGGRLHDGEQDDQVGAIVADATGKKQEFINDYDRQPDGSYLKKGANAFSTSKGDRLTGQQFNSEVDQFRLGANKELSKHGAQIDATGTVQRKGPTAVTGGPVSAEASPSGSTRPAPDGTRRQAPDGTIEVKTGGKWVKEP